MYHTGHVGINTAIAAGFLYFTPDTYPLPLVIFATAVIISLSSLPDIDHHIPLVKHRGITHTLVFGAIIGLLIGRLFALLAVNTPTTQFLAYGIVVGLAGITGHLIGDSITPMGVKPLHPFIETKISFNLFNADNRIVNIALFLLGTIAYAHVLVTTTLNVTL